MTKLFDETPITPETPAENPTPETPETPEAPNPSADGPAEGGTEATV